jgi:hypothetical protein
MLVAALQRGWPLFSTIGGTDFSFCPAGCWPWRRMTFVFLPALGGKTPDWGKVCCKVISLPPK